MRVNEEGVLSGFRKEEMYVLVILEIGRGKMLRKFSRIIR